MTTKHSVVSLAALGLGVLAAFGSGASTAAKTASTPTFSEDIAPIVFNNCTSCHRPGENAPFTLMQRQRAAAALRSWRVDVAAFGRQHPRGGHVHVCEEDLLHAPGDETHAPACRSALCRRSFRGCARTAARCGRCEDDERAHFARQQPQQR